jgi:hypothetical protein
VVELVDTLDLGSSAERCESSSLSVRTKQGFAAPFFPVCRETQEKPLDSGFFFVRILPGLALSQAKPAATAVIQAANRFFQTFIRTAEAERRKT